MALSKPKHHSKNSLEVSVIIKLSLSLVLLAAGFITLSLLEPSDRMNAEVEPSEFIKKYNYRDLSELRRLRSSDSVVAENRIKKVEPRDEPSTSSGSVSSGVEMTASGPLVGLDVLDRAVALVDAGNYQQARDLLEKALLAEPNNEKLLVELGMIYLIDYRQPESAQPLLERALRVNPSNKVVLSELVGVYEESGQAGAGLEFVKGLLAENPDHADLNLGMAQMLTAENRTDEAAGYYENAIMNGEQPDYVYSDLAELYFSTGRPEKGIQTYKVASERALAKFESTSDPSFRDLNEDLLDRSIINLVSAYRKTGQIKAAEKALSQILSRRPNHQEAQYQMAQLRKNRG